MLLYVTFAFTFILFQARKYMKDFKSTHCVNLPSEMFETPWDVNIESDFVFT